MSKQIKITSYNLFKSKIIQINDGSKSMYFVLNKLILYGFSIFLEQSTRVSYKPVSYKPVSYKKTCIYAVKGYVKIYHTAPIHSCFSIL